MKQQVHIEIGNRQLIGDIGQEREQQDWFFGIGYWEWEWFYVLSGKWPFLL
jgi:hypothetical protein